MLLLKNKQVQNFSLALLILFAFSIGASAQPKATPLERAKDAGTHENTKTVTVEYSIKNEGNERLSIQYVRPSCSCLTAVFDSIIEPGKTGKIKVKIDLAGQSGEIYRELIIKTSDPVKSTIQLSLKYTAVAKTSSSAILHHPGQEEVGWASQKRRSLYPAVDAVL